MARECGGLLGGPGDSGGGGGLSGTLVLGRPTNRSITANLLAPTPQSVYLEFGLQAGVYTGETAPLALAANLPQEVTLTGLTGNSRYYYRIRFRPPARRPTTRARSMRS